MPSASASTPVADGAGRAADGRALGGALALQLAGMIVPFVLLIPVAAAPRGVMDDPARDAAAARLAVLLLFGNGALTVGISAALQRRWGPDVGGMASMLVAAAVVMLATQAVDNAQVMALLSLNRELAAGSGTPVREALAAVGAMRGWMHTIAILAIDAWMTLLYVALYRVGGVPRGLAVVALATVLLHAASIPLRALLGGAPLGMLGVPMAVGHLLTASWVMVRGLRRA